MHYTDFELNQATALLGGLSPNQFMQRHWQKKPLLIRAAVPADSLPLLSKAELFQLARQDDVQSRLVQGAVGAQWTFKHGPFQRLPSSRQKAWTVLVQGVNLHDERVAQWMQRFRFVPDARLDDVMISYATDGGGVGPHYDRYDVFLLQASGKRRWRIAWQECRALIEGLPLKILQHFEPEQEFELEAGDMLYLPPMWSHEGVAIGTDCMTYSVGFRQPSRLELVQALLEGLIEFEYEQHEQSEQHCVQSGTQAQGKSPSTLLRKEYSDKSQGATVSPAKIPEALQAFALNIVSDLLQKPKRLEQLLGEYLSAPKAGVYFDALEEGDSQEGTLLQTNWTRLRLHRKTQMLYDSHSVYINGNAWWVGGKDARLLRDLADKRVMPRKTVSGASQELQALLERGLAAGWMVLEYD